MVGSYFVVPQLLTYLEIHPYSTHGQKFVPNADQVSSHSIFVTPLQYGLVHQLQCRYENTERRAKAVAKNGLGYMGMGVSGGEEGARNGTRKKGFHYLEFQSMTCWWILSVSSLRVSHSNIVSSIKLASGPSMMPGGSKEGYDAISHIVEKVAAQVDDGPCVTYIGPGGAGEVLVGMPRSPG